MDGLHIAGTLSELRKISVSTMNERVQIKRQERTEESGVVPTTDELGDPITTPQENLDSDAGVGTTTRCRISGGAKTEQERAVAGRLENPDLVVVALPVGTDVREGDQLAVSRKRKALPDEVIRLEVMWVPDPVQSPDDVDLRVMAQREA